MQRCLEWIRRQEVIELQEVTPHLRGKEDNRHEHDEETRDTQDVMYGVERMERNTIQGATVLVFLGFNIYAIRIV